MCNKECEERKESEERGNTRFLALSVLVKWNYSVMGLLCMNKVVYNYVYLYV